MYWTCVIILLAYTSIMGAVNSMATGKSRAIILMLSFSNVIPLWISALVLLKINGMCSWGHHSADNIFKCIFIYEKFCILTEISLKVLSKGQIDNKSALVEIMAWCQTSDKPTSHYLNQCWPSSLTHIFDTRGRCVNDDQWKLLQAMVWCHLGTLLSTWINFNPSN